jgi:hypothetical protein
MWLWFAGASLVGVLVMLAIIWYNRYDLGLVIPGEHEHWRED